MNDSNHRGTIAAVFILRFDFFIAIVFWKELS